MALIIKTPNPTDFLSKIKKAIDDKEIDTWSYDSDNDFTHVPSQWERKAWLRPRIYEGELRFGIIRNKRFDLTKVIYAVYHGRFSEMLLTHFDNSFSIVTATAKPLNDIDIID